MGRITCIRLEKNAVSGQVGYLFSARIFKYISGIRTKCWLNIRYQAGYPVLDIRSIPRYGSQNKMSRLEKYPGFLSV